MATAPGFDIRVQKGFDLIDCGAALVFEMGGHDIGCTANLLLYACSRLLCLNTGHRITLTFLENRTKPRPALGQGFDMTTAPENI